MSTAQPLLSPFPSPSSSPPSSPSFPISIKSLFSSSSSSPYSTPRSTPIFTPAPLAPLPEHSELPPSPSASVFSPCPSSPSLKSLLIYGPSPADDPPPPSAGCGASTSTASAAGGAAESWLANPFSSEGRSHSLHRSRTAPSMSPLNNSATNQTHHKSHHADVAPRGPSVVRSAMIFLTGYLLFGVIVYSVAPTNFTSSTESTHPVVDALYFCIVTMCTIGYGDITPATPLAKIFSISFVIIGFGFVDILMSGMVSFFLDLQESLLLAAVTKPRDRHRHDLARRYIVDVKKGRMRIRLKVALALGVVLLCIGVGSAVLIYVERLDWLDALYLSVMSVTTVGYGDHAFKTMAGRLFAAGWLLVSTLAVARAFLYLAEMRIDRRHRKIAKWVLSRDMTVSEFLAADIDHNGFVTKSEFVVYKLKEMGKVSEKDISLICEQFERLDSGKCGKITLSDLIDSHHLDTSHSIGKNALKP